MLESQIEDDRRHRTRQKRVSGEIFPTVSSPATTHNAMTQLDGYSILIIVVFFSMMVRPEGYIDAQNDKKGGTAIGAQCHSEEKHTGSNSITRSQERYKFIV